MSHPATLSGLSPGRVAIITGAGAPGIGFSQSAYLASHHPNLKLVLCDINLASLEQSLVELAKLGVPKENVKAFEMDVGKVDEWARLKRFLAEGSHDTAGGWEDVAYLGLNAGVAAISGAWAPEDQQVWETTLSVNLWGVVYGGQALISTMISTGKEGHIVITGSKQGITCPPGNLSYNVSKAAVKSYAEGLEHQLRSSPESSKIHAHLLVPGWVDTKLTNPTGKPKPEGAWTPEQTVDYAFAKFAEGKFYSTAIPKMLIRKKFNKLGIDKHHMLTGFNIDNFLLLN